MKVVVETYKLLAFLFLLLITIGCFHNSLSIQEDRGSISKYTSTKSSNVNWSEPIVISTNDSYRPIIESDSKGNLHSVWFSSKNKSWGFNYVSKTNKTWENNTYFNFCSIHTHLSFSIRNNFFTIAGDEYITKNTNKFLYYSSSPYSDWKMKIVGRSSEWKSPLTCFNKTYYVLSAYGPELYSNYIQKEVNLSLKSDIYKTKEKLFYVGEEKSKIYFSYSDNPANSWSDKELILDEEIESAPIIRYHQRNLYVFLEYQNTISLLIGEDDGDIWKGPYNLLDTSIKKKNILKEHLEGYIYDDPPEGFDIAVDSEGEIHMVWQSNESGNWEIYYQKCDQEGNIDIKKRITYDPSISTNPDIAVDDNDVPHIVWQDNNQKESNIFYRTWNVTMLDNFGPEIFHIPTSEMTTNESIYINATIKDDSYIDSAKVYFKSINQPNYTSVNMKIKDGSYKAKIQTPTNPGKIEYFISVKDIHGNHNHTSNYKINVISENKDNTDDNKDNTDDKSTVEKDGYIPGTSMATSVILTTIILVILSVLLVYVLITQRNK